MQFKISDVILNDLPYVKLEISSDFKKNVWDLIKSSLKEIQNSNFKEDADNYVVAEWFALLQILPSLKSFRDVYKFEVIYSDYAKKFISEAVSNSKTASSGVKDIDIGDDINEKLNSLGFDAFTLKADKKFEKSFHSSEIFHLYVVERGIN